MTRHLRRWGTLLGCYHALANNTQPSWMHWPSAQGTQMLVSKLISGIGQRACSRFKSGLVATIVYLGQACGRGGAGEADACVLD